MPSERYSRNEGLFGAEGQAKIEATSVAVFGLGGLGSHVVQQLAYLGTSKLTLVDFDHVTDSSLNRLVGAIDADVAGATKKTEVARRLIAAVNPDAEVTVVDGQLEGDEAATIAAGADVLFGCLDRDLARLHLLELAANHGKPLFDLATDSGGDDSDPWYGGRVALCDGRGCVVCLDLLDQVTIKRDALSPDERAADERIYGVRRDALEGTGPMVISINGVVASLAVTEFVAFTTGLREPVRLLQYYAHQGVVRASGDVGVGVCYFCDRIAS